MDQAVVLPHKPPANAKKHYVQSRSLYFQGERVDPKERATRCGGVAVPPIESEVTIATWFSVTPPPKGVFSGGILLGAQSVSQTAQGEWPTYHHQFIHLDTEGNLYCALTRSPKKPVATNLLFNRWYHVAMTYDGAVQQVYLDGELIDVAKAAIHYDKWYLGYTQVGSGGIAGNEISRPTSGYYGWYSFHGMVDDFCM